jgi:protein-L-isoaspartate(D-aspartate) O-methyltransferase
MVDYVIARRTMVDRQIRTADVTDRRLIAAMGEVPREAFVPAPQRLLAYSDAELAVTGSPGGPPRALVAPAILGRLIQLLAVAESDIVLDVGCATGYAAAILGRMAASVVALDADPVLATMATQTLVDLDIGNVAVVIGPMPAGYAGEGPYDAILVEGAVEVLPDALFDQLRDGGRLAAVVGSGPAGIATLYRRTDGEITALQSFNAPGPALPGFLRPRTFVF